jgi:hypothetical protein
MLLIVLILLMPTLLLLPKYRTLVSPPQIQVVMQSIAGYSRLHGHLPSSTNKQIPWNKIGISRTFFRNRLLKNIQYDASFQATSTQLLSVDCLHWIMKNIIYGTKFEDKITHPYKGEKYSSLYDLNETICVVFFNGGKIEINIVVLLACTKFYREHLDIDYKSNGMMNQNLYVAYPTARALLIDYVM